ncbi:hypothetical protein BGZ70_005945, partial [Mortierella alpina]
PQQQQQQQQARIETLPDVAHMTRSSVGGDMEAELIVSEAVAPASGAVDMTPSVDSTSTPGDSAVSLPPVQAAEAVSDPAFGDRQSNMDAATTPVALVAAVSDPSTPAGLAADSSVPSEAVAQVPETQTLQPEPYMS